MPTLYEKLKKKVREEYPHHSRGLATAVSIRALCKLLEEEYQPKAEFRRHVESSFGHGQFRPESEFPPKAESKKRRAGRPLKETR